MLYLLYCVVRYQEREMLVDVVVVVVVDDDDSLLLSRENKNDRLCFWERIQNHAGRAIQLEENKPLRHSCEARLAKRRHEFSRSPVI